MWRDLTKVLRELRRTLSDGAEGAGAYRPDRHYMRGPGPKWHAKYGGLHQQNSPAAAAAGPALHEVAGHRA
jgi:hypothetical protein